VLCRQSQSKVLSGAFVGRYFKRRSPQHSHPPAPLPARPSPCFTHCSASRTGNCNRAAFRARAGARSCPVPKPRCADASTHSLPALARIGQPRPLRERRRKVPALWPPPSRPPPLPAGRALVRRTNGDRAGSPWMPCPLADLVEATRFRMTRVACARERCGELCGTFSPLRHSAARKES
jgi:hypothetical protein